MNTRAVKPLLSVIVPVTKMAGKMNLLASWTIHTLDLNIEVIIIHDVGDLVTGTELKKLIHENSLLNVILIEGRYGSPGFARNAGLEVATGEWFVFWDSDDRPLVDNVMLALSNASASDEIIIGNFNTRNYVNESIRYHYPKNTSYKSVAMNPGVWRMIFRSEIINELKFTNLRSGEDQVFLSQLNFVDKNCKYVQQIFYEYSIGQVSQLTNSLESLSNLPSASELVLREALHHRGSSRMFDLILIIRQQITLIRRGNFTLKLRVINFVLKFVKNSKLPMLLSSIQALLFVVLNLRRSRII